MRTRAGETWTDAAGSPDWRRSTKLTPNAPFRVASTTKLYTATVILTGSAPI